jgi:predicted amidohydrolase
MASAHAGDPPPLARREVTLAGLTDPVSAVSLVQVASPPDETPDQRRQRVAALIRTRAAASDLIVLPELWANGYFEFEAYPAQAEDLGGPTVTLGRKLAAELGCHLHLGSVLLRDSGGGMTNTALLIGPDGEIAHRYEKIHVFGYQSREAELLRPGASVSVAATPLGLLTATTCYDLRFPELWRALVDAGAELAVVPAAWPAARREHWRLFTSCRAVEEQVYVIACNAVGPQRGGVLLGGHSRIVDPWGEVVLEAGDDEGVFTATIDRDLVRRTRAEFPVLGDRVPAITTTGEQP